LRYRAAPQRIRCEQTFNSSNPYNSSERCTSISVSVLRETALCCWHQSDAVVQSICQSVHRTDHVPSSSRKVGYSGQRGRLTTRSGQNSARSRIYLCRHYLEKKFTNKTTVVKREPEVARCLLFVVVIDTASPHESAEMAARAEHIVSQP